jgi:hypothetical protein
MDCDIADEVEFRVPAAFVAFEMTEDDHVAQPRLIEKHRRGRTNSAEPVERHALVAQSGLHGRARGILSFLMLREELHRWVNPPKGSAIA